jgi:transcription elongation factor Elf1
VQPASYDKVKEEYFRHFLCYLCRMLEQVQSFLYETAKTCDIDCKACQKKKDVHKMDDGSWP